MRDALTTTEEARLAECEGVIIRGLKTFYEVGNALAAIRDARLYRQRYATFEDYCQERWGMVGSRARQLIAASVVVENVRTVTDVTPTTEAQCRPLVRLDPAEQAVAWREAVKTSGGVPSGATVKLSASSLGRDDRRLEEEPWPLRQRILAAKHVILRSAIALLTADLDFEDIAPKVLAAVGDAESAGYEVLESSMVERLARGLARD